MHFSISNEMMREIIMDHYQNPRNRGLVDDDSYKKVNMNSETCIDNLDIYVLIEDNLIKDIKFTAGFNCDIFNSCDTKHCLVYSSSSFV